MIWGRGLHSVGQCLEWDFHGSIFYMLLILEGECSYPLNGVLCSDTPPKVAYFGWIATNEAILTIDNLRKKGKASSYLIGVVCERCGRIGESFSYTCQWIRNLLLYISGVAKYAQLREGSFSMLTTWHRGCRGETIVKFGMWCLFVLCGAFGEKGIVDFDKDDDLYLYL